MPLNNLAVATAKSKKGEQKTKNISQFQMLKVYLNALKQAKEMITTEMKLVFPDFSKIFHLYADASDIQLGTTLIQDRKPLGSYMKNLNNSQVNYTMGEKELLEIVEGLKAFS